MAESKASKDTVLMSIDSGSSHHGPDSIQPSDKERTEVMNDDE